MAERFIRFQEKVLKYNEAVKAVVNALTKEAGELYDKYKENVVSFLCEQILAANGSRRIALFYLVDSIVKNVRPYARVFEDPIRKVFIRTFQEATVQKQRDTMIKLHRLWKGYFSEVTLRDLQSFIDSFTVPETQPQLQPHMYAAPPPHIGHAAPYTTPHTTLPPPPPPMHAAPYDHAAPPAKRPRHDTYGAPGYPAEGYPPVPAAGPYAEPYGAYDQHAVQAPVPPFAPYGYPDHVAPTAPTAYAADSTYADAGYAADASAAGFTYPPPSAPAAPADTYDAADLSAGLAGLGDALTLLDMSSLDAMLGTGMRKGFKLTGGAGTGAEDAKAVKERRAASKKEEDEDAVDVSWPWLRKYRFSSIKAITSDLPAQCRTCGLRLHDRACMAAHLDVHFRLNARLSSLHGRGTVPARQWYMDVNQWARCSDMLFADESTAETEGAGAATEEEVIPQVLVEGDNEKSKCFVCGDGFEQSFDEEMDDWVLKGALAFDLNTLLNTIREQMTKTGETFNAEAVIADMRVDVRSHDGDVIHWKCYKHLRGIELDTKPTPTPAGSSFYD